MFLKHRNTLSVFLAATCAFASPAGAVTPTVEEVGAAFRAMPREVRLRAQANLIASDLYSGNQDGVWGPGTARGFRDLMALEVYRDFARTLPDDRMEAARATVLWGAPEAFAD